MSAYVYESQVCKFSLRVLSIKKGQIRHKVTYVSDLCYHSFSDECSRIHFQGLTLVYCSALQYKAASALQRLLQEVEMLAAACSKDFGQKLELRIWEVASLPAAQK